VNLISEICINLINISDKKLNQFDNYISIFKIFEKLRKDNLLSLCDEKNKKIIDSFLINVYNENIFLFITDGCSYLVFRLVIDIISNILEKDTNLTEIEIKEKIKNETNKKINKTIMKVIGDKSLFDTNIYNIYKIFHNLRKNKIRHCLIYIGEKDENKYEEYVLKYINFDNKNKKEFENYLYKQDIDDIVINHKISEYINTLNNIKYDFCEFLKNSAKNIYSILNQKKKDIILLFNSISLEQNDLITIKFFVNEKLKNENEINKLNKFYIKEVEYFTSEEMETAMEKLKYSNTDITLFIDNSSMIVTKFDIFIDKEKAYLKGLVRLEISLNKIVDLVDLIITKNKNFFKKKFYKNPDVPKNHFNSEGILDFSKLSKKINDELKINIDIKKMDEIANIKFDVKEKNNYIDSIIKNIDDLNKFLCLNQYKENTIKLKKKYEENFSLLMENIKASIFYDFIYFSLYPKLKFKEFLMFYELDKK